MDIEEGDYVKVEFKHLYTNQDLTYKKGETTIFKVIEEKEQTSHRKPYLVKDLKKKDTLVFPFIPSYQKHYKKLSRKQATAEIL